MSTLKIITLAFLFICCYSCRHRGDFLYETTSMYVGNADASGEKIVDDGIESLPASAYSIKLVLHNVVTEYAGPNKNDDESGYLRKYPLTEFKIYSLQNYNQTHPANSDVSEYFDIGSNKLYGPNIRPNPEKVFEEKYYYKMTTAPDSTGNYSFKIRIQFEDESSFIDTANVKLLN